MWAYCSKWPANCNSRLQPSASTSSFFDAEDYGIPYFYQGAYKNDTWCLGSQYWGRVPHVDGYNARYGILLDMVGGQGSKFSQEGLSKQYAQGIVDKVWAAAEAVGFGSYFPSTDA